MAGNGGSGLEQSVGMDQLRADLSMEFVNFSPHFRDSKKTKAFDRKEWKIRACVVTQKVFKT